MMRRAATPRRLSPECHTLLRDCAERNNTMLEQLRRGASSWVAKIFLLLLVLSFGVWGIADIFRGFGTSHVATVGGIPLGPDEYRRLYDRAFETRLDALSQQLRQRVTPEIGRQFGIDRDIDKELFAQLLLDAHARDLNLGFGEETIAKRVIEAFSDDKGNFDRDRFEQVLRRFNLSEAGFFQEEKTQTVRAQLLTVLIAPAPPNLLIDIDHVYRNEQRTLEYFSIASDKVAAPPEPTDAQLTEHYEAAKQRYMAPEYRKLGILLASPDGMKAKVEVTEEELKEAYKTRGESFDTPERRRVLQLAFADKAEAEKAAAALRSGKDFVTVAKDFGRTEADYDRGLVAQSELADKQVAEAAFKIARDTVSDPIEGSLSTSIVKVIAIEPGVKRTYEDVKDKLRDQIALEKVKKLLPDLHNQVEDLRAAATPFKEIADKLGLQYLVVDAVDASGKDPSGKLLTEPEVLGAVLRPAFESDVGVEIDPVDLGQNGEAFVEVIEITPTRQMTLAEVKDRVKASWIAAETQKAAAKYARDLVDRAGKGEDFAKLAAEAGGSIETSKPLKRDDSDDNLSQGLLTLAFNQKPGVVAQSTNANGTARVVFRVKEITSPKPLTEEERKARSTSMRSAAMRDTLDQYVAALEKRYGISSNPELMRRALGQSSEEQP